MNMAKGEDSAHGDTFEERFRGKRNVACDRGGDNPHWDFPTPSSELKTFSAKAVAVSHCLPMFSPGRPLEERWKAA